MYVYVLKCKEAKYYVGKSKDPMLRIDQHVSRSGSAWTKKFPPVQVERLLRMENKQDENNLTLELMEKYGIDNVRGGMYSAVEMPAAQKQNIQLSLDHNNDRCLICGLSGHFANSCPSKSKKRRSLPSAPVRRVRAKVVAPPKRCERCGRTSHSARSCYAKTRVDGHVIVDSSDESSDSSTDESSDQSSDQSSDETEESSDEYGW